LPKKDFSFLLVLGLLTTLGIVMIANLLVGIFLGRFLDKHFHTHPWLTLLFLFLGLISGAQAAFRLINNLERKDHER